MEQLSINLVNRNQELLGSFSNDKKCSVDRCTGKIKIVYYSYIGHRLEETPGEPLEKAVHVPDLKIGIKEICLECQKKKENLKA